MKKFFTLIAAVAMAASMNAQTLSFDTDYAAGSVPETFSTKGLVLTVVDTNKKLVVDANSAYFGTADSYQKFDKRLKSGGKSSSKNNLTLTLPSDGTLKVYARTGSSSATDRNVILTQNDAELANYLKVSRRTLQEYRNNGILSYYQIGGKILYRESDIEELLEKNRQEAFR